MKKIIYLLSLVTFVFGSLTFSLYAAEEDDDFSDIEEYDLYDRNRDDRDFNRYNYPDIDNSHRRHDNGNRYYQPQQQTNRPCPYCQKNR